MAADFHGFVSRVVEELDLHFVLRIIQRRDRGEKPVHDVHLVENRELDRDQRDFAEIFERLGMLPRVFQVKKYDRQPV